MLLKVMMYIIADNIIVPGIIINNSLLCANDCLSVIDSQIVEIGLCDSELCLDVVTDVVENLDVNASSPVIIINKIITLHIDRTCMWV